MRNLAVALSIAVAAGAAHAQGLAGRSFTVDVKTPGEYTPVTLPIEGAAPAGALAAVESGGATLPLTAVGGYLYAVIPPKVAAGTHTFTVEPARGHKKKAVQIEKRKREDVLEVRVNGDLLTEYHYSNEDRKPFLWPLNAEGGVTVTRDWPMGERVESGDHPHHVSFWTGYGDINGADYWEYGDRTGWQHTESIDYGSGDAVGWIQTRIIWQDKDHKPVIQEDRTYRFYATPASHRLFDVTVHFTAAYGQAKFGDTKEGGMVALRMNDRLRERGGSGTITNSEGGVGAAACWGKPASWCDYSGTLEGVGARGIAVFDHPSSFRYPTHWHVRDYGLMGANAFGYSYFYEGAKNGDYTLPAGDTMTFNYRIYVHSGDVKAADVADYYADFARPPKAAWTGMN